MNIDTYQNMSDVEYDKPRPYQRVHKKDWRCSLSYCLWTRTERINDT